MFNTSIMATVANIKTFAEYFRAMSAKLNFSIQSRTGSER